MEKRIARYALLVSLAMVLSWLESLIVFPGLLPGMKVGLTNLVVVFARRSGRPCGTRRQFLWSGWRWFP